MTPLSNILVKIFTRGFYTSHAGMFLFAFLILFGMVEPGQLLNYHYSLMLGFITDPLMLIAVLVLWLLYAVKSWHYVLGQIDLPQQYFLRYSAASLSKTEQAKSWFVAQFLIQLPIIGYGFTAAVVALIHHYYLASYVIIFFLLLLTIAGINLYINAITRLKKTEKPSILLQLSSEWYKPFFSLFIYHVSDKLKLMYLITKGLSWVIIISIFNLFADVSQDIRVAGIAVLGIATAHTVIIFEAHRFRETRLIIARNLPYSRFRIFTGFSLTYLILLLPEIIWLFCRFSPSAAIMLSATGLSAILLFNSILYLIGLNMERYLQWILGLFNLLFWVIMFRQPFPFIACNLFAAFIIFHKYYYKPFQVI